IRNGVYILATRCFVCLLPACCQRFLRWLRRYQTFTATNQIAAPRYYERLAHLEIVLWLEELQQRPLHLAVAQVVGDLNLLFGEWVHAGVVHARGNVERRGDKILHLIGAVTVALQEQGQIDHRVQVTAGMAGDEVRHKVLFRFTRSPRRLLEIAGEGLEIVDTWLLHHVEHAGVSVLWGDFEMGADVVRRQFAHVFRRELAQVHADAAGDEHLANARLRAGAAHQLDEWTVVRAK